MNWQTVRQRVVHWALVVAALYFAVVSIGSGEVEYLTLGVAILIYAEVTKWTRV